MADDSEEGEALSAASSWKTIACHSDEVGRVADSIAHGVGLRHDLHHVLQLVSRWHDLGKSHPAFQGAIRSESRPDRPDLAKAPRDAWPRPPKTYRTADDRDARPGLRHELASSLALFAVVRRYAPTHPALLGPWIEALELMDDLADELARDPVEGPGGASLGKALEEYRRYFESNYVVPLALLNAIGRYRSWEVERALASTTEREAAALDLRRLYRLDRYPQIATYYLFRHTYFASAEEATCVAFDRLLARMSADPERSPLQLIELSDLQAAVRSDEDRLVFSRVVFPRLRSAQALDIFRFGEGGARQLIVLSYVAHRNGAVYSFGETYNPVEIGQLYRLLFLEHYPKQVSEQDRHYVVKDCQERVVGGICYRMMYPSVAYLDSMVVASSLKRGGLGTAVLDDFCGRMAGAGVGIVLTHAHSAPFFLRRGFEVDKKWGGLVRYV